MKRLLLFAAGALALLLAVLALRAATLDSAQVRSTPPAPLDVDTDRLAQRLARTIRHRTVSHQDPARIEREAFRDLHGLLFGFYTRVHAKLDREFVNGMSALYTWPGRDPQLAPVLLAAHLDVVPANDESAWTHAPFAGVVVDGAVWGRGALDDKASALCMLEAVELLIAQGFSPQRTVYLAFGHDEEVGGDEGALAIAELLRERGVGLDWVLDEGGLLTEGFVSGLDRQVAVVGVAEKGSVSIALDFDAPGGHSSTPPPRTAIGELARAVVALEEHPLPSAIDGVTAGFIDHLAPELPFAARLVLANRWLFDPLLSRVLRQVPPLDAMQRTTTAVTIFDAGVKENILPRRARAIANFRIHPRDSIESVTDHVRRTIDDERIALQVGVRTPPREPSPVSPADSEAFRLLAGTIRALYPQAAVAPYLVVGGTDARHYARLTPNVYRFLPFSGEAHTMRLVHGVDEHITIDNLERGVRFYAELIRRAQP